MKGKTHTGKIPDSFGFPLGGIEGYTSSLVQEGAKLIRTPLNKPDNMVWNELVNKAIDEKDVDLMNDLILKNKKCQKN